MELAFAFRLPEAPLRERLTGQLMVAHYRSGRQADANATYQRARQHLVDELGLDPAPELQRLEENILTEDPDLDFRPQPPRTPLPARFSSFVGRSHELDEIASAVRQRRLVTVTGVGGVSMRLGHKSVAFTLQQYEHVPQQQHADAVERLTSRLMNS